MKNWDLTTGILLVAIIGIGAWIWKLMTDSGSVSTTTSTNTVTLTDSTGNGQAATQAGELIDQWQENRTSELGNQVIDFLQQLGGHT